MNSGAAPRICLGRIIGVHGLKGELKARLALDDLETLTAVGTLEIDGIPHHLVAARFQRHSLLLSLTGVQNRDQAEKFIGKDIWIDPTRLPALPPGEYYWFEILGLSVFRSDNGAWVGEVAAILPTPAHDVYVIEGNTGEYLIPAVAEVILAIEPEQGRLVIAPEGLTAQSSAY